MKHINRIWELDFFRGIAIILMIVFHFVVDLTDFYNYKLNYLSGFWYLEGKLSAILFILIAGICSTLNNHNLRHGIKILSAGMVLTLITYLFIPFSYIRFGILHLLGVSLLTANKVRTWPILLLILTAILILISAQLCLGLITDLPYFIPLGIISKTFTTIDYYPLIPWYSVFLFGIVIGKLLYASKRSRLNFNTPNIINKLGQHSLIIYFIHQPILLAMLYLIHSK